MRTARPVRRAAIGLGLAVGALAATASATEPIGDAFPISNQLPAGNPAFDATDAAIAHDPGADQYLVVWSGETATDNEREIFTRLIASDGSPVGAPTRISEMGPDGDPNYGAGEPDVAFNPTRGEYLVTWTGDDDAGALVNNELEVWAQRLNSAGAEIGPDLRLSDMGPDGDESYGAAGAAVAYNPDDDEYLVAWDGDDNSGSLVDNEREIFVQRLSGDGAEIGGDTRVSTIGPDGDPDYAATTADLAYNATANEYLLVWAGDDAAGALVDDEFEVYAQRLSGAAAAPVGKAVRVSDMGSDGNTNYQASDPAVVHNADENEYLVVWSGDDDTAPLVNNESEIFAQRLGGDASGIGVDTRISDMGPDGDADHDASKPAVAYNTVGREYLVSWEGDDDTGALVDGEVEIFAQRISPAGLEIERDTRISSMGPDGNPAYDAASAAVSHAPGPNEFLIAWHGDDDADGRVEDESEVYGRRVMGGPAPTPPPPGTPPGGGVPGTAGAPSASNCLDVGEITGAGATGTLSLSPSQLRINQRIGQAAVRRANAIQRWLDAGIVNGDLCGGTLAGEQLDAGVQLFKELLGPVPGPASPRALDIATPAAKPGVRFALTAAQLKINQNVYSAAVRRANALSARINGRLTGGDIANGQLTGDKLRQDLRLGTLTPAVSVAVASSTQVAAPLPKTARFTPTLRQLRINQKIAQAAVRRTNDLRQTLARGLTAENFADESITAIDWAP